MPAATGYFVLCLATLLAVIQASTGTPPDLTLVIASLLVLGAVIVLAERR